MGSFSPVHWLIVIAIILLLFGPSRIAGLGKGLGEGIRSFKKGISEDPPEEKPEAKKLVESKGETTPDAEQQSKSSSS